MDTRQLFQTIWNHARGSILLLKTCTVHSHLLNIARPDAVDVGGIEHEENAMGADEKRTRRFYVAGFSFLIFR